MADVSVEDAVKRNADALIAGNIAQLFTDITPEAMTKLTQMAGTMMGAAQAGSPMPKLTSYEIVSREQDGDDHIYDVRFSGDVQFGVKNRWREVNEQWKLVDFDAYPMGATATAAQQQGNPPPCTS